MLHYVAIFNLALVTDLHLNMIIFHSKIIEKIVEKIMVVYIELHLYSSNYPGDSVTSKQLSQNHIKKK
jgi:hypothetical protein